MMAMWYVYSSSGSRLGPITDQTFRKLVQQGTVKRNTIVANQYGRTVAAGSIPGLPFPDQANELNSLSTGMTPSPYGQAPCAAPYTRQTNPYSQNSYGQPASSQVNPFQSQLTEDDNPFLPQEEPESVKIEPLLREMKIGRAARHVKKHRKVWVIAVCAVVCVFIVLGLLNPGGTVTINGKTFKQPASIHGIRLGDKLEKYRRGKWKRNYEYEFKEGILSLHPTGHGSRGPDLIQLYSLGFPERIIMMMFVFDSSNRTDFEKEVEYIEKNYHFWKTEDDNRFYRSTKKRCPPNAVIVTNLSFSDKHAVVYAFGPRPD